MFRASLTGIALCMLLTTVCQPRDENPGTWLQGETANDRWAVFGEDVPDWWFYRAEQR